MKSLAPLDLIRSHKWQRATLTTYSLSASFTEAVIVEALLRQGVADIALLTDALGFHMTLREHGAVRIGREYTIHPVVVTHGCFHPKLLVLEAEDEVHALVGSANLTFGGWSANLECIDHVDNIRTPGALAGLARFFSALASSQRCSHDAASLCTSLGTRLALAANKQSADRTLILNSLEASIASAVVAQAAELGGALRLTCVSPYWEAAAVDRLASELAVQECFAHVPQTSVPAPEHMDWPRRSTIVRPVTVTDLRKVDGSDRGLHAKLLEVKCREGRLVLCGSANATLAGLYTTENSGNVEVCTLRIEAAQSKSWSMKSVAAPKPPSANTNEDDSERDVGILTAEHSPTGIEGRILTPWPSLTASATIAWGRSEAEIGSVKISPSRDFTILADNLDEELDLEGRVQLRLTDGDRVAEGFVSAPHFKTFKKRAGATLPSMLAALKQLQTPDDVLAILEFFRSNPDAFRTKHAFAGGRRDGSQPLRHDPVIVTRLVGSGAAPDGKERETTGTPDDRAQIEWQRLIERLLASMAKARPSGDDADDEHDRTERATRKRAAAATARVERRFPGVFQELARNISDDQSYLGLLRLTNFVCVTTLSDSTRAFIERLVRIALEGDFGIDVRQSAAWCSIYLAGGRRDSMAIPIARARLLKFGLDPGKGLDGDFALPGLPEVLAPNERLSDLLSAIEACRTIHEDIRVLEAGLEAGRIPDGIEALMSFESWPRLREQLSRDPRKRRVHFVDNPVTACPKCNISLLPHEKSELARRGICETQCHGFILTRNG